MAYTNRHRTSVPSTSAEATSPTLYMPHPSDSDFSPSLSATAAATPPSPGASSRFDTSTSFSSAPSAHSPFTNLDDFPDMVEYGRAAGAANKGQEVNFEDYLNFDEFDSGNEVSRSSAFPLPVLGSGGGNGHLVPDFWGYPDPSRALPPIPMSPLPFLTEHDIELLLRLISQSHSPTTTSPTRTPPNFNAPLGGEVNINTSFDFDNLNMPMFGTDLDYLNEKPNAIAGPSNYLQQNAQNGRVQDVVVKQEPVEFGWNSLDMDMELGMGMGTINQPFGQSAAAISPSNSFGFSPTNSAQQPMSFGNSNPLPPATQQPAQTASTAVPATTPLDFAALPLDQQMALQQLMLNIMSFQANIGFGDVNKPATPATSTINPNQIFAPVDPSMQSQPVASVAPDTSVPSVPPQVTAPTPVPAQRVAEPPRSTAAPVVDEDDELLSIADLDGEHTMRGRSMSTFSAASNMGIDERLDKLAPLSSIFSIGRGKGGKKGGGMSSVVRGEEEDLDDDDSWRPSAEEYKKLSSKEKRQLRNKLSARAFRNRRKDYIGTLEGHIRERDNVIDEMRSELQTSKSENQDLRRELEALKKSTMSIIHPATAVPAHPSQVPSVISALSLPARMGSGGSTPSATSAPLSPAPRKLNANTAPTPQFNPRKDLPANGRGRGAGGEGIFGGPPTICHTILTPELTLGAVPARQNMNPLLAAPVARGSAYSSPASSTSSASSPYARSTASSGTSASVYSTASSTAHATHKALNLQQPTPGDSIGQSTFQQWADENPFSLRTMDAYRMQMWSRLAREAQADKAGLVGDLRPKFYTESLAAAEVLSGGVSAKEAKAKADEHITAKLAQSFLGALTGAPGDSKHKRAGGEGDKFSAVVTGRTHLRAVQSASKPVTTPSADGGEEGGEVDLVAALSGLKLQSGPGLLGPLSPTAIGRPGMGGVSGRGVRNDPLGVIGGFLRQAAHPTRA